MNDVLEKMMRIEAECEDIQRNSELEVKRIKENAAQAGKDMLKEKKRDANRQAYELVEKAKKNADAMIERTKQETVGECADLAAAAGRNIKKAAEYIVEKVLSI